MERICDEKTTNNARRRVPDARQRKKTSSAADLAGSEKFGGSGAAASGKSKEPIRSSDFPSMAYGVYSPLQAAALEEFDKRALVRAYWG